MDIIDDAPTSSAAVSLPSYFDLEFSVPLSRCARAAILSQTLTSLSYLLAQTPVPPEGLRRWATSYTAASATVAASRGGRPVPRSATARRALDYLSRLDALDCGVRGAVAAGFVHAAVLVFGPTPLAPRLVVHVSFADASGVSTCLPQRGASIQGAAVQASPPAGGATTASPEINQELPPEMIAAITRKVARVLITAGPDLFGGSLPTLSPLPMHTFLLVSPAADCARGAMPDGWLPRAQFSLRARVRAAPKRAGSAPRRPRYALADIRVRGQARASESAAASTLAPAFTDESWWQWVRAPKGLRMKGLPPLPKVRPARGTAARAEESGS